MPIETVSFRDKLYPAFQANGNSPRFIKGFVDEICKADYDKGEFGYNVGCGKISWNYPEKAIPIDLEFDGGKYHALNLPKEGASYLAAYHLIEHLPNYVEALNYWYKVLKPGGNLLLYVPHPDQERWLPQFNPRHLHIMYPKDLAKTVEDIGFESVFYSERDLYWAFLIAASKPLK